MDYYQLVKENAEEREELTRRQDEDVKLRDLDAYVMEDLDGNKFTNVVHVTLNRPKVIFEYIKAALSVASEQIIAETEQKDLDTDYIEDFRRLAFAAVDARLQRNGLWKLNSYIDEQSCIRGGSAARCLFQMVDDELVPDITCWDYRYVNYEEGSNGVAWASYGLGTKRKKASIESEPWAKKNNITISSKEAEVVDVWTPDHNEIWLDKNKVYEQAHAYGFTPVVIRQVSLGSMLSDAGDIKNRGEGVFMLIRPVMPELNRLISIIQTHNLLTIKRAIQTPTKEGIGSEAPDYDKITAPGASTTVEMGGFSQPVNLGDVTQAAVIALNVIDKALEEGGLSLDIFRAPLGSGVAIIQAKEGREIIYLPRLEHKAQMKQGLGDMLTAQVIQIGGTVEIGTPGHKRQFQTRKLEGQYEVTHKFAVRSLTTDAGLASLAASYGRSMSEHTKRREIYQMADPDGEERWLSWEEAGRLSPIIRLRRTVEDLKELGEDEEARLIVDEAGVQLEQLLTGNALPIKREEGKEPTQMVSLFGGGAGRSTGARQPEVPAVEEVS